jgi:hypothetical protein
MTVAGPSRSAVSARVHEVQLDVVAGQHPRQLAADVAEPEDRDRATHRLGLQQQGHLAATALPAVVGAGDVVERHGDLLGGHGLVGELGAGPGDGGLLEVAAADGSPRGGLGHDHLGARLAGCVAADRGDGDQHRRLPVTAQGDERVEPADVGSRGGGGAGSVSHGRAPDWRSAPNGGGGLGHRRAAGPA